MNHLHDRAPAFGALPSSLHPATQRRGVPALLQTAEDFQYREMEQAFRASGGIANSDGVTTLLRRRTDQPISVLARWIVSHAVLSFDWRGRTMLPLFQFDLETMTLRPSVTQAMHELTPALNDWEIALWFARPNAWLDDAAPVDTMELDPRAVHEAARADRYLTRG